MEILARGVGRRKEAVAQVQIVKGTGQFIINNIPAQQYLHNSTCSMVYLKSKSPLTALNASAVKADIAKVISETAVNETGASNPLKTGSQAIFLPGEGLPAEEGKTLFPNLDTMDTIVKVKGGGLVGQAEAIRLGLARALCLLNPAMLPEGFSNLDSEGGMQISLPAESSSLISEEIRKQLKDKGYLTQDSRVKERRKYGLKKARKATQYNKR